MTKARYKCDQCGACCKQLLIEIGYLDVLREPKLRQASEPFRMAPGERFVDADDEPIEDPDPFLPGALLACGSQQPCPLLGADNHCTIYPSRPNVCVAMQAGDEQCQDARRMAGLTPLPPLPEPLDPEGNH